MLNALIKKIFGSRNERILRRLQKNVAAINSLEESMQKLSESELRAKTAEFRQRHQAGESLDALLPEAFAVVREASIRTLGLRHFDVQLIGGMVLHQGKIAEMRTGEGKTLVGTLPAYLNAIPGKGVHIVTVNDYLAKRDSAWMTPIYELLGLTVGVIYPDMPYQDKQAAYQCDITYGTNNEFGFDYLRDNMAFSVEEKFQRELNFAIVDEVDSILIDEARTPLIISGPAEDSSELYIKMNAFIPQLVRQMEEGGPGDYSLDEKQRQVHLTEEGHQHVEQLLADANILAAGESLYHPANIMLLHHLNAALRGHVLFHKDVDYIVTNNQVVIVDEFTGRIMPGRRWSDGLHQAVEAKENVAIQNENQTLASITFQNYFRLYQKLAGMTGTADTEAYEFQQIYNLEVVVIPTNKPMIRQDLADLVYLTQAEKFNAVIQDIKECRARMQPVLVGTASIEASELLSNLLNKEKIPHQVLNAKMHEKEAMIIAEAGRPGIVTIATNMAGRGTDIVLGGNLKAEIQSLPAETTDEEKQRLMAEWQKRHDQVIAAGGLRIIGSERHESRRIDNQLRGRAGRQGDAGSSSFYLSLEDNLMRIFASDRVAMIMKKLGMKPGEAIEHPWVSRAIENAQRKVEGRNFDIRKQLLDYDNVANDQRQIIYYQRNAIMTEPDLKVTIDSIRDSVLGALIDVYLPPDSLEEQWDIGGLEQQLANDFRLELPLSKRLEEDHSLNSDSLRQYILQEAELVYRAKEQNMGRAVVASVEKSVMLQVLDTHWREHLSAMDYLRQGIHLRGYAQKDPKQEYKREAFELFSAMLERLKYDVIKVLFTFEMTPGEEMAALEQPVRQPQAERVLHFEHPSAENIIAADDLEMTTSSGEMPAMGAPASTFMRTEPKVGRNSNCPCGSGKKYKNCHGKLD